jgi:DNA-directed RNA polymerase omega subunit
MLVTTKNNDFGRYTSENAAHKIGNIYDMILIASLRARELRKKKYNLNQRETLVAIREVEEGLVGREYLKRVK